MEEGDMFALGQEPEEHGIEPIIAQAAKGAAELRDQLYEENQGTIVKVVVGVVVGLYVIYRFLIKR